MKRWAILAIAGVAITACQDASAPEASVKSVPSGMVAAAKQAGIPGSYIVTLRDDVVDVEGAAKSLAVKHKGALKHVYKAALKGFALSDLTPVEAAALAQNPLVKLVEEDQVMTAIGTETGATWGIDRVDQHSLPLDQTYNYGNDGSGVTAYIIDTGIRFDHTDFGGRARKGIDEVTSGGTAADCNGHGTHVSGTVAGARYGVAKNANLVAVRVLNCQGSGTTSGVIAGIDWVTANRILPAAANMSLGGGFSTTLNAAVARAVASGVTFAVAAGNSTADACNSSPSSEASAITVGATDINDGFASFSNFGTCVDINAPGVNITSDWYSSSTATNTISGTSMATPHVTGAAVLYLATDPTATPAQVTSALNDNASTIPVVPANTTNRLLFTAFVGAAVPLPPPPPPPPTPPQASFTHSCSGLTCNFTNTSTNTSAVAGDVTAYSWTFGDGGTANTADASHTYPSSGRRSYTITLQATDSRGSTSASQTVTCNKHSCS
ncbi:MAG: S8 family serine peptidase [Gemmatimonadaceae bacterium]